MTLVRALHNQTIELVVEAPGPPDDDGVPTTTTSTSVVDGVNIQPVISADGIETSGDTMLVTDRWKLSGPPGMGLTENTKILWNGDEYRVWGRPQEFGTIPLLAHTEAFFTRWGG